MKPFLSFLIITFSFNAAALDVCSPEAQKEIDTHLQKIASYKNRLSSLETIVNKAKVVLPQHSDTLNAFLDKEKQTTSMKIIDVEFEVNKVSYRYLNCRKDIEASTEEVVLADAISKLINTLPDEKSTLVKILDS